MGVFSRFLDLPCLSSSFISTSRSSDFVANPNPKIFCFYYFGADFSDFTDWDLLTSFAFDLDFFGAVALACFLVDLDFDCLEAFAPFAFLSGLEDLVGEAATRDLAGDVFLEAVFSFAYSNSVSSFLADCLLVRLAPEAATADFLAVVTEGFL